MASLACFVYLQDVLSPTGLNLILRYLNASSDIM